MTEQFAEAIGLLDQATARLGDAHAAAAGLVDVEDVAWPNRIAFMIRMVETASADMRASAAVSEPADDDHAPSAEATD